MKHSRLEILMRWASRLAPVLLFLIVLTGWRAAFIWLYGWFGFQWMIEAVLLDSVWTALVAGLLTWVIVLQYRVYSLQKRIRPRLKIEFDNDDPDCLKPIRVQAARGEVERTGVVAYKRGVSVRLRVCNPTDAPAWGCEGALTKVEFKKMGAQSYESLALYEPHRIPWALDEFKKVDISPSVPRYLGVIHTLEHLDHFAFRSDVTSAATQTDFSEVGEYRFSGAITADEGGTAKFALVVHWDGRWDRLNAFLEESG